MTKARKAVLGILDGANQPLSALEVGGSAGALCDTATIYRALHYLEENGLAESFVLHCATHGTERYYVSHNAPHRHWFHCERCHRFVDLGACKVEPILREMEKTSGVAIRSHTLYATGICADCAALAASADCAAVAANADNTR
ncbi:MAG: transcriptional repressor [Spirochaetales bacterium]|jgi:Fur family ferric uptake transcriptional regulator